jgi:hypothetical protein
MEAPDSSVPDSAALSTSGPASLGQVHFGACVLGDKRRVKRAVQSADAILSRPGGTLPAKLHDAQLTGFYDLVNNPKITHANLIAAHTQRTLGLMKQTSGVVLILHDTTEADFSSLSAEGLGQIGNGWGRGFNSKRRLTSSLCPVCSYDLRASPDRCPECGTVRSRVGGWGMTTA